MSDKSFTFFELHFHDGVQLGPKSLEGFNSGSELTADETSGDETTADEAAESEEAASGGGSAVGALLGLGVLAAAAYAVRKLLNGPSGLEALDDIEDLDEFGEAGSDDASEEGDDDGSVAIEVTSGDEPTSGRNTGLLVAVAVTLLVLLAVAAKKLLGGDVEEIELPDELAEE